MPDAKRKEREAARRAAQKAAAEAWRAKVDLYFGYVRTTYGFRITSADASSVWVTRVIYQSDVAAVAVERSVEFDRVEVSVIRLVDGQLPEYPIFIVPDTIINQTLLDNMLLLRNPDQFEQLRCVDSKVLMTTKWRRVWLSLRRPWRRMRRIGLSHRGSLHL